MCRWAPPHAFTVYGFSSAKNGSLCTSKRQERMFIPCRSAKVARQNGKGVTSARTAKSFTARRSRRIGASLFFEMRHHEVHRTARIGWLRAAVLGANDGIVSTASLVIGVAAAEADRGAILIAGLAGLVAGSMSMAAGEYVSVHSQADTEKADLEREKRELAVDVEGEIMELAGIYVKRGLKPELAREVAIQLMEHDALGAHARDELGISEITTARPLQAALFSAFSFAIGAALPLGVASLSGMSYLIPFVAISSLFFLALLGAVAAHAGGASLLKGSLRVLFWGAAAMAVTALIGRIFGTAIA